MAAIQLSVAGDLIADCVSVIVVPEIAVSEPGYIRTLTSGGGAGAKHEFHTLAQMACYQFQDDELEVVTMRGPCRVRYQDDCEELRAGLLIYRLASGEFRVAAHEGVNRKKLLEAANRFCTRWVRLDI